MDSTFLSDNYVWIIVIAVVVVMTVIGYIADKTKFGDKKPKEKKENKKEPLIPEEDKPMDDFMVENHEEPMMEEQVSPVPVENYQEEPTEKDENLEINSFDNSSVSSNDTVESSESSVSEPTTVEFPASEPMVAQNMETPAEQNIEPAMEFEMPQATEESTEENTTQSIPVENQTLENQNVDNSETENLDFKLPSIDKLNQEIADVEEEEDVWKF